MLGQEVSPFPAHINGMHFNLYMYMHVPIFSLLQGGHLFCAGQAITVMGASHEEVSASLCKRPVAAE